MTHEHLTPVWESDYESNLRPKIKELLDFLVETARDLKIVEEGEAQ